MRSLFLLVSLLVAPAFSAERAAPRPPEDPFRAFLRRSAPAYYQVEIAYEKEAKGTNLGRRFSEALPFCDVHDLERAGATKDRFFDVYRNTHDPNLYFMRFKQSRYLDLMWERVSNFGWAFHLGKALNGNPAAYKYEETDGLFLIGPEIAGFFNLLEKHKLKPTAFEETLRQGLLAAGRLTRSGGKYEGLEKFAVSIVSDQSNPGTIVHETNHAVMHNTPRYAAQAKALFHSLTAEDKRLVQSVLHAVAGKGVDVKKDALTFYFEFTAYFRDPDTLFGYYKDSFPFTPPVQARIRSITRRLLELEEPIPALAGCGKENPNAKAADPNWVPELPSRGK